MNEITIHVLLEFLYTKFAVTFILCLFGSLIREAVKVYPSKNEENVKTKMVNLKRMATSTIFSTFLMCACADYVELQFSIYALICVLSGIWGLAIVNVVITGNVLKGITKNIANPIIRGAIESTSKELEKQQKEEVGKKEEVKKNDKEEE